MRSGQAHYLFVPLALIITGCAVIADRRRMKRVPLSVAVGVLLCGLAPMQAVAALISGRRDSQLALGSLGNVNLVELLVLALLVTGGLVLGRNVAVWRRYAPAVVTGLLATAGVNGYLRVTGNDPGYYFGKMLHVCVLILIVGVGAVGRLARPMSAGVGRRTGIVVGGVVLTALALGQVVLGRPSLTALPWFTSQVSERLARPDRARTVVAVADACTPSAGVPTVVFYGDVRRSFGYYESIFLGVLQRQAGAAFEETYGLPRSSAQSRAETILARAEPGVRVVVGDDRGREAFAGALRAHPEWSPRVTVVDLGEVMRSGRCTPVTARP